MLFSVFSCVTHNGFLGASDMLAVEQTCKAAAVPTTAWRLAAKLNTHKHHYVSVKEADEVLSVKHDLVRHPTLLRVLALMPPADKHARECACPDVTRLEATLRQINTAISGRLLQNGHDDERLRRLYDMEEVVRQQALMLQRTCSDAIEVWRNEWLAFAHFVERTCSKAGVRRLAQESRGFISTINSMSCVFANMMRHMMSFAHHVLACVRSPRFALTNPVVLPPSVPLLFIQNGSVWHQGDPLLGLRREGYFCTGAGGVVYVALNDDDQGKQVTSWVLSFPDAPHAPKRQRSCM